MSSRPPTEPHVPFGIRFLPSLRTNRLIVLKKIKISSLLKFFGRDGFGNNRVTGTTPVAFSYVCTFQRGLNGPPYAKLSIIRPGVFLLHCAKLLLFCITPALSHFPIILIMTGSAIRCFIILIKPPMVNMVKVATDVCFKYVPHFLRHNLRP
ncbi:hypothetical protein SAMN05660649_00726 [Desulfotomaculum arcticum]|uniref:Uncharacterized protein n=1 Tax=Desulfotruncus arcticus DSM 17038 TaxID=1121424 RepID=A0A1I2P7E6_9FIRM|nr:hypothetical protein SAMN05660649_00726 [Desulfotomaculum arcticum] [Desulfotruncus arcticus DSM 17038]